MTRQKLIEQHSDRYPNNQPSSHRRYVMPRFAIPVTITLSAQDAHHAQNTVECSSLTSLEIPGLIRISVGGPKPLVRTTHHRIQPRNAQTDKK